MTRTMRRMSAALICLLMAVACAAQPRAKHVFIVSFDGGKPSVMRQSNMPTLFAMAREGASTWSARTVFPSITLVAHTSMLTGMLPAHHGIDWNDWIPEKGLVKVPTVFAMAHAHGMRTALFASKEKFKHLNLPGTIDTFELPEGNATGVAAAAARYIETARPNLCFIHFTDGDATGHAAGWGSETQVMGFAKEDVALDTLRKAVERAGIASTSVFLITADHGGHDKTHGAADASDMTIPWIAWGAGVRHGAQLPEYVRGLDTTPTALWLLGLPVPENLDGMVVDEAFEATPAADAAENWQSERMEAWR